MRTLGQNDLNFVEQLFTPLNGNPFFVKDGDLNYVAGNFAMASIGGFQTAKMLVGKRATELFPTEDAERYEALDRRILAGERPVRDHLEPFVGRSGSRGWVLFSRFPVRDWRDKIVGVAVVSRRLPRNERDSSCERVAAAAKRIRKRFNSPLDVTRLAADLGISKSQLERNFLKIFGTTMQTFLHAVRMEHALKNLEGDMSITSIAHECGYTDHSAFTRRFRQLSGITPREYRSNVKGAPPFGDSIHHPALG